LRWVGFPAIRVDWWRRDTAQGSHLGRIELVAARRAELLESYDRAKGARATAAADRGAPLAQSISSIVEP
jgi:hypothetical protein